MRTCVDDMVNDAEGVFDNQAPRCVHNKVTEDIPFRCTYVS